MLDYKDGSGLQFIKLDFVTGGQEIKFAILWNFAFFTQYLLFIFLLSLLSPYFKIL